MIWNIYIDRDESAVSYALPRNPETTITLSEKDAVNGTLDESKAEGTNVKANSASVDTQKTWQLKLRTNGGAFQPSDPGHGKDDLYNQQ